MACSRFPNWVLLSGFFLILVFCIDRHFHVFLFSTHNQEEKIHYGNKTGRLEDGLGRSRAAIHDASRSRHRNLSFRKPCIYRNPIAFHQSYKEMEKRLRIWVYKEGNIPLFHIGPMKEIYSIEGHMMELLHTPHAPLLAPHPDVANVFFLPISITYTRHYAYAPQDYDRHLLQRVFEDYVTVLAHKYPYWNRSSGADHFFIGCHDWGPDATSGDPIRFRNMIRVLCNANVSEGFRPFQDVSLPEIKVPSIGLNPPDGCNQSPHNRNILGFFAGGRHGYVRKMLFQHWKDGNNSDMEIQVHEYLPKGSNYFDLMSRTKFCLCPSGHEVASPRLIESMHTGCVPVIISDGYALPFGDVLDWTQFSVHIPVSKVAKIKVILKEIDDEEYLKMQKKVLEMKKHFLLNRPHKRMDLLHMVLHSIWLRRLNVRLLY